MPADLSIVIVSWNCCEQLAACLRSLRGDHGVAIETVVVDNASSDGAADMVRNEFPEVTLIANTENRGFAAANNQGIETTDGRHVLLLNPDTVVHDGALAALVRTLDEDESVGACGAKLLNEDGSPQGSVRRFPTLAALLYQYSALRLVGIGRRAYREYKMRGFNFDRPADVDSIMGAALCVPRRVLEEVGLLDADRFFVYFEEVDLCRRIHDAGYRCRFEPAARVTHVGGVSAAGNRAASLYLARSMFRYLWKHLPKGRAVPGVPLLWLGMMLREVLHLVGGAVAALVMLLVGQLRRASRRWQRARSAARFLFVDAWRVLLDC